MTVEGGSIHGDGGDDEEAGEGEEGGMMWQHRSSASSIAP